MNNRLVFERWAINIRHSNSTQRCSNAKTKWLNVPSLSIRTLHRGIRTLRQVFRFLFYVCLNALQRRSNAKALYHLNAWSGIRMLATSNIRNGYLNSSKFPKLTQLLSMLLGFKEQSKETTIILNHPLKTIIA